VCKCVLPPGDNPTAVNKYIIPYISIPDDYVSMEIILHSSPQLMANAYKETSKL
jgi:hypothetical protein